MRRARGFKEIQPKESIGYTEDQRSSIESIVPEPLNHFGIKSEATDYQEINGSRGMSNMDGLSKAKKEYGTQAGQEDFPRNDLADSQIPPERRVTMEEIFPPAGIPPFKTSHHPSVPCAPVGQDEMVDMNPFPYMFKSKYDFKFDTFKDKVLKDIKRSKNIVEQTGMQTPEREGGYTSILLTGTEIDGKMWVPPHQWPELDHFIKTWLPTQVKKLYKEWNLSPQALPYISESWTNEHTKGSFTEGHHHHNCQVALSCYLDVPENSGRLMIKDPMEMYSHSRPLNYNHEPLGKNWRYIDVETNDVLFFPGFLQHQTERSESNDNRYIMSINISYLNIGAHMALGNNALQLLWDPQS
tara:strand:+ start:28 stop:1092 length:1065 start_codon:yes stop_codon:yes gene_type:complete